MRWLSATIVVALLLGNTGGQSEASSFDPTKIDASFLSEVLTDPTASYDVIVRVDGHAMIEWAPLAVKERVAVWDAAGPTLRLMKGIKERLDPRGILNPGRFVGGI